MKTVQCQITKKELPASETYKGSELRGPLLQLIQQEHPDFTGDSYISIDKLNEYRKHYISQLIEAEVGEISQLEKEVIRSIQNNKLLSENIEEDINEPITFGQRVADKIASFGGSWTFIIIFFSFLALWMMINIWMLANKPFDPYPFILLNLILSCLAAIQAPIIMMSQNRQEDKDRQRSEHDYKVNLKAEIEIRLLHEKLDHLMVHQNSRLLEIQQLQADYLEDILQQMKDVKRETSNVKP
ncbi:DUF1003 domain-containing protein [Flavisolibacter ginsenosidimutans]|uniref:DUF1003 domain-containing protein n=1 Tax=Flavisolibacter ginsenosidimutans TaxID=661481 RepID=A0A5B8UKL4_9BACT|nr:DUF1003 domain-containing protein [Flavisolibacter ginsenosidimutans]QEC56976.1 DUF1003 domain-containing protein [Flavisolibacter ginsenosidimutans]